MAGQNTANRITIKGVKDGLLVTIAEGTLWDEAMSDLMMRIDEQGAFFKGARLAVSLGDRPVRPADLSTLRNALSERGVGLWAALSVNTATKEAARLLGLETVLSDGDRRGEDDVELAPIDTELTGSAGVLVRHTLRSGGIIRHSGHVVVIGDVNPGAEIVAGGDVVVWGRLRGVVSAGANGDESAVVCALDLSPTQLRIAGHIAISPTDKRRMPRPEVACVRDGRIIAVPWDDAW